MAQSASTMPVKTADPPSAAAAPPPAEPEMAVEVAVEAVARCTRRSVLSIQFTKKLVHALGAEPGRRLCDQEEEDDDLLSFLLS